MARTLAMFMEWDKKSTGTCSIMRHEVLIYNAEKCAAIQQFICKPTYKDQYEINMEQLKVEGGKAEISAKLMCVKHDRK